MDLNRLTETQLAVVVLITAAVWGLYWVPLHLIEAAGVHEAWSAPVFNFGPLVAGLPLLIWHWKDQRPHFRPALLAGVFFGAAMSCYAIGIVASSVIRATMLFYLLPIWATIIGKFWLGEKLTLMRVLAVALGLGGLYLLLATGNHESKPLNIADGIAFFSGLFWAIGLLRIKLQPQTPIVATCTAAFATTATMSVIFGLWLLDAPPVPVEAVLSVLWFSVPLAVLLLLPSVAGVIWVSRRMNPGRVGILMMAEVLVAIVSAAIFLPDEAMVLLQWLGCVLIILACVVEILSNQETSV